MTVSHYQDNEAHGDDEYLVKELDSGFLDVVLDGVTMGRGGYASRYVKRQLEGKDNPTLNFLRLKLKEANDKLSQERMESLTTVTVAYSNDSTVHVLNAGDSPAYLMKDQIEMIATMDSAGSSITNAVGIGGSYSLNKYSFKPEDGDKLLIATDGITDNLEESEIEKILEKESPDKAVKALKAKMKVKKERDEGCVYNFFKEDDATAIIRYL